MPLTGAEAEPDGGAPANPVIDASYRYLAGLVAGAAGRAAPDVRWLRVAEMARRGRVEPIALHRGRSFAPPRVIAGWETSARKVAFTGLRSLGERDRLLTALDGADVGPVVLLKGAVLGWLAYPDPLLRSMNDLDLLVAERFRERAADVLRDVGYRHVQLFADRPISADRYHEQLFGRELVPGRVNQAVEIHTGFVQTFRHAVDYEAVLERAVPFPPGGATAFRLDDADQLLHLALHMAREQFLTPLKHLLDVHLWIGRGGLDWDAVIRRARAWGAATAVGEALRLTRRLFSTFVPAEVMNALRPSGLRGALLRVWHSPRQGRLVRREVGMRTAQVLALLPLLDDTQQRLRFLGRYATQRLGDAISPMLHQQRRSHA